MGIFDTHYRQYGPHPDAHDPPPATERQLNYIRYLLRRNGMDPEDFDHDMNIREASEMIDDLLNGE